MRALLFAVCDNALLDANTNAVSLINILSDLHAAGFPIAIPRLAVVGMFERADNEPDVNNLQLKINLNGMEIANVPWPIDFQGRLHAQGTANLQGLVVVAPGVLRFGVEVGAQNHFWDIDVHALGPTADLFTQPSGTQT
jgi:hypothetical protein